MSNRKLVITLGDPNSIGPEIVIKALKNKSTEKYPSCRCQRLLIEGGS